MEMYVHFFIPIHYKVISKGTKYVLVFKTFICLYAYHNYSKLNIKSPICI